jgi:hypothetical protein
MKKLLCALGIFCFFTTTAIAGTVEEKELKKQKDLEIQKVIEKYEPQLAIFSSKAMASFGITFPTTPPADALTGTFITSYPGDTEQLTIWIWRERNFIWAKVEPLSGPPNFSYYDFTLIQNNMEYDIRWINSSGASASGDLTTTTVFQLSPYSYAVIPDLISAFDLKYDYRIGYAPHVFQIPAINLGDITGDGKVGLEEAINALQVTSGLKP